MFEHLQRHINYTKIVAIAYIRYVLVVVTNSIITAIICVLVVGHKWMIPLVIRREVEEDSLVSEGVDLVDLVVDLEDLAGSVGSEILIDSDDSVSGSHFLFHSYSDHLILMMKMNFNGTHNHSYV